MKAMDSRAGQGANPRHGRRHGEDLQRRHAREGALVCFGTSGRSTSVFWPNAPVFEISHTANDIL